MKHNSAQSAISDGFYRIEDVYPKVDDGRYPVKRVVGETIEVWADIYRDGHEITSAALIWRPETEQDWLRVPMTFFGNDRWFGSFTPMRPGRHTYAIEAWTDEFSTWRHGFELKQRAGTDSRIDTLEGASLLTRAQSGCREASAIIVASCEEFLRTGDAGPFLLPLYTRSLRTTGTPGQFPLPVSNGSCRPGPLRAISRQASRIRSKFISNT